MLPFLTVSSYHIPASCILHGSWRPGNPRPIRSRSSWKRFFPGRERMGAHLTVALLLRVLPSLRALSEPFTVTESNIATSAQKEPCERVSI